MPKTDGKSNTSTKEEKTASSGKALPPRNFRFSSGDLILIIGIVLFCAFLIAGIFIYGKVQEKKTPYVRILSDGQVLLYSPLRDFQDETEYFIETNNGKVVVLISSERAVIVSSDCPDQICVKQGELTHIGQGAVCLPNKVVVEIVPGPESDEEQEIDGVAR